MSTKRNFLFNIKRRNSNIQKILQTFEKFCLCPQAKRKAAPIHLRAIESISILMPLRK